MSGCIRAIAYLAVFHLTACDGGQISTSPGELKISKSTPVEFEATYVQPSGAWAHVHRIMGLYATRMLLDTSSGEVYRNDGLGLADASRPTVFRRAEAGSADEAL